MELNRDLLNKAFMAIQNFEGFNLITDDEIINLSDALEHHEIGVDANNGMDCDMVLYILQKGLKEGWIHIMADNSHQKDIQYLNRILNDFKNYNKSYLLKD